MQSKPRLLHLTGLNVQGDIGGVTTYKTRRKRVVTYPRASPLNPPSPKQEAQRDLFTAAAAQWRQLTANQQNEWRTAAAVASLAISGINLWNWYYQKRDRPALATIERISGIALTLPT